MSVRLKFAVKDKSEDGRQIHLQPAAGDGFEASGAGVINLYMASPEVARQLEPGKEYFVDISPAS